MSAIALTPLREPMPPLPVRRFTVDEYHEIVESGILDRGAPCELIHGWIIPKMGINPPHAYAVNSLMDLLVTIIGSSGVVRIQQPITTNDSEPEPDVVVASGSKRDYRRRHPAPADVHLAIEVSDTTLHEERTTKLELYAKAGIECYWIVNIPDSQIEVHTLPRSGKTSTYRRRVVYKAGDSIPVFVNGKSKGSAAVDEILP